MTPQQLLDSGERIDELDISHLVIEDDTPVDNFQSEEQQRLLVEPVYSSKVLPAPFLVAANVGVFYKLNGDPIVPDVLLSLGVQRPENYSERRNRSYFVWEFGKVPEVCIEIVSNAEGDELKLSPKSQQKGKTATKKDIYAQIGVRYYVVFDPLRQIQGKDQMNGAFLRVWTISPVGFSELTPVEGIVAVGQSVWLDGIGLGLTLWEGEFEQESRRLWLRWCDSQGQVIPTGAEAKETERQRAETERQRAETERQRAEQAESQLEAERRRAEQLAERLRAMGLDPDQV
jgi:Uma2 family endonuclease